MILGIILACEVGFWIVVGAGLLARYPLRRRRLGLTLLAMAPVVDLVLLAAVGAHLRAGHDATWTHSLAAIYLGISVAYGHRMIGWADERFAHRWAGGPPPTKLYGAAHTRHCWADVGRTLLALAVTALVTQALVWWVGDPARTQALTGAISVMGIVLLIDTLAAVSYTFWPRRQPTSPTIPAA